MIKADRELYKRLQKAMWRAYHRPGQEWVGHSTEVYLPPNRTTVDCSVCTKNVDVAFAVLAAVDTA